MAYTAHWSVMNFAEATHFVRYTLAHSSDAQLKHSRLTTRDRDALLEKPVIVSPYIHPDDCGFFDEARSHTEKMSVVRYGQFKEPEDMLDTAAHEQFHAAKYWGGYELPYYLRTYDEYAFYLGAGTTALGILFQSPFLECAGLALAATSHAYITDGQYRLHYHEEMNAHRFGHLFNPHSYAENGLLIYSEQPQPSQPHRFAGKSKKSGHPDFQDRVALYKKTVHECLATEPTKQLFPNGAPELWEQYHLAQTMDATDIFIDLQPR